MVMRINDLAGHCRREYEAHRASLACGCKVSKNSEMRDERWIRPPWDQRPEVRSPVGRPIAELLEEGPQRQPLAGFEPVYRDFVDYIVRCTHRIWEEKNVGLCRTHYAPDCQLWTLAGPVVGAEAVVQNTIGALAANSDRVVVAEDVIWSEEGPGLFYSSHRITSWSTHLGDDPVQGLATALPTGATTIADCLCEGNRIIEEWLVRDNLRAVWQLGGDPHALAAAQADADRKGDPERHSWRSEMLSAARSGAGRVEVPSDHPASVAIQAFDLAFSHDLYGEAAKLFSETAEVRWPAGRRGYGRGYWIGCLMQLRQALHEVSFLPQHVAARSLPNGDTAVALRWTLAGRHLGAGVWGPPSGRDILIMAVSHLRVRDGRIVEDISVFDELAILRQTLGGLGA